MAGWTRRAGDTLEWARQWAAMVWGARPPRTHRDDGRPRHLLLIVRTFPPEVTGGVFRPHAIARYAGEQGWRTTVLAGRIKQETGSAGDYLVRSLPDQVRICRPAERPLAPIARLVPRVNGGLVEATELFELATRELDRDPPGAILASGPPFNTFITARHLARRYEARLILDYRDEWTVGTPIFVKIERLDRRQERLGLAQADAVVFVSESIRRLYVGAFPFLNDGRCHLIVNGWDPEDLLAAGIPPSPAAATKTARIPADPGEIRLTHVGTLGPHLQPDLFLRTLGTVLARRADLLRRLRLLFVGHASVEGRAAIERFPFPDCLTLVDRYLPKPEVLRIMRESTALLVLNGPTLERAIPGKLYEYLACRVPVLAYGDGGEIAEIVREIGGAWMVPLGDESLERCLDAISRGEEPPSDPGKIAGWLAGRTRQEMVKRICELAEQTAGPQAERRGRG
jgi:glycosyltransferase involved in cell wall biosynthesis